jgi:hypothetical protein
MTDHFHTGLRPLDGRGEPLKPLDLVVIEAVPWHYWAEPETETLKQYAGRYGLITYYGVGPHAEPYYYGKKDHPGWVSGDGGVVNVLTRRVAGDEIASYEFWIPPSDLRKIPFNALIMNVFVEYPWQMRDTDGPSDSLFIREPLEEFSRLKTILETPLHVLQAAHDAAMSIIANATHAN